MMRAVPWIARMPHASPFTPFARLRLLSLALLAAAACQVRAQASSESAPSGLRRSEGLLSLEYQTLRVPGDEPLDLAGWHAWQQLSDGVYAGAGFYAPLFRGAYGGFVAADLGVHLRRRLGGPWVGMASLSVGGGGGGRSVEHSKLLSGTGGFAKGDLSLGYDVGALTVGAGVSRLKFRGAALDGSQWRVFVDMPFSTLTGSHAAHGQALSPADDARAGREMGETLLTLGLDNYHQRSPQGSNRSTISLADLQFSHFLSQDTYWFASLGMGWRGLPLYNQLLGGLGQRWRLTPAVTLYGQLGLGSGGYSPDVIDTRSGLLVYPKVSAELALGRDLGLAVSVGAMAAPRGSSRNETFGLSLTRHLRSGGSVASDGPAVYQGLRLSVLHQSDLHVDYREERRPSVQMLGLQLDLPLSPRWYLPLQASGAYTAYLGYPGYAEILGGLGVQTLAPAGERWQGFAQLMAGANVHGKAGKASAGLRYLIDDRLALSLSLGRVQARSAGGGRFVADNVGLGLDYRFSVPAR